MASVPLTVVEDPHGVGNLLDDREDMRREEEGRPRVGEVRNHLLERPRSAWVQSGRGFVEEDDVGLMKDGLNVGGLLAHSFRVVRNPCVGVCREIEFVEESVNSFSCRFLREIAEAGGVFELFVGGRLFVQRWFLG